MAISAITLLEVAVLFIEHSTRLKVAAPELFAALESEMVFRILPLDVEIAQEIAAVGAVLRDPADRTIVATARVHSLRLVTPDQRIIESNLVPVIE